MEIRILNNNVIPSFKYFLMPIKKYDVDSASYKCHLVQHISKCELTLSVE